MSTQAIIDLTRDSEDESEETLAHIDMPLPLSQKRLRVDDPDIIMETDDEADMTLDTLSVEEFPYPEFTVDKKKPSRSWFYTLNSYTEGQVKKFENFDCVFHVFGREVGASGTPHLQGCITFKKTCRLSALKKLEPKAHWEIPKSLEAARNYCLKDDDIFVRDNRKQGERTDLMLATDMIKDGKTVLEVATTFPTVYVKYPGGITSYSNMLQKPRVDKPRVSWYYGATGTGKTASVFTLAPRDRLWTSGPDLDYFNGYNNQPYVLFDDFRGDIKILPFILRLFDRYPINVNVKYGYKQWNPTDIYVTSAFPPVDSFYGAQTEDMEQLLRRIDNIVQFEPYDYETTPAFDVSNVKAKVIKGLFTIGDFK